jgi:hypothetical protein
VRLKLELYRLRGPQRSAVILDNYNALGWRCEFFHATSLKSPARRVDAQELTLGANLRVLDDVATGDTAVIAAVSLTGDVPDVPMLPPREAGVPFSRLTLPALGTREVGSMLQYYRHVAALSPQQPITQRGVEAAQQLAQGDGTAVRRNLHFLLPYSRALDNMDAIGEAYADVNLRGGDRPQLSARA